MNKKELGTYLIAASIIIASFIISQSIKSNSANSCFDKAYKQFSKNKNFDEIGRIAAAKRVCQ